MQKFYRMGGFLEVYCGAMFSGKSTNLLSAMRNSLSKNISVQLFKHAWDTRTSNSDVCTHDGDSMEAYSVSLASDIIRLLNKDAQVIGIDEVQFFDDSIIFVIDTLVRQGKHVICACLDLDFRAIPFGPVPTLLALADRVHKLSSICVITGERHRCLSQRMVDQKPASHKDPIILVGGKEHYVPVARHMFEIDEIPLSEYCGREKK